MTEEDFKLMLLTTGFQSTNIHFNLSGVLILIKHGR